MPDINENRKAIYNALAKKGVNMGTYEQFDRAMSDTGNRKAVYDAARKHGINVGDYDTYENAIYASQQKLEAKPVDAAVGKQPQTSAAVQKPQAAPQQPVAKQQPQQKAATVQAQQPQQPKGHPMTEADKARMDESIADMISSTNARIKNTSDWMEGISKRNPLDVGVKLGTDLLANGQKRNKNVVQKGGKYITQSGNAYDTAEEANEEQEEIDWQNSNAAKVAKMQKELEGLDKQIADEEGRLRVQTLADKDAIMYSNEKYNTMQKELGKTATSGKLQQLQQRQKELRNSIANLQRPGVRASVERMNEDLTTKIGKAYEAAGNKYRESGREGFDKWLAPMGGESTAYGGGIQDAYNHDYDVQILESARRSIKNAQNLINEADINAKNGTLTDWLNRSFAGGAARGLGQSAFDLRTWDFGLNDAVEAKNLLNILKKADNGQKLTANEQALLDAKATEAATLAYFGNEAGRGYKAGQVTGMSLPFMVQIAVHPAAALGKTSQGMMMRYMVKRFGTAALKRSLASRMLTLGAKGVARLGGDIAAATAITSSMGLGNVAAETMQRMAGNIQGDFTDKELKHIGYLGTKDREDATSAAVKSFVNNVLENFTEMGHVDVAGKWVKKGLAKITPKGLEKGLERFTQNDFAKALRELGQRTQFHGTIGEYLEEKEGDALRLILGTAEPGANWGTGKGGFFNLDENIDTFLGVSLMGGAFGVMGAAGYRTERYNARKAVENAGAAADAVFARVAQERNDADILTGENGWRQMRNTLSFGSDEEVKDVLTRVFTSDEFTPEQRKAVAQYAGAAYKMRGINIAEAKAKAGGDNLMSAYDEGRSLSTAEEMNDARNMYEYRRKQAAEAMGISEDELDAQTEQSTPEMYLLVAMQQGADKGKAVEKYINSKARFDGMIDGLREKVDDKANEAEDAIRQNTNRSMEDAQVVEATLADGTHGYIVSGVVDVTEDGKVNASGTADFMTMRTDDGKVIAVAPSDIETASVNYADALIEQTRAEIEEQESTAAEADIENGGLNVEQGAPVNFVDDSGQVVNAVSEGVTQTEDGQTIVSLNVNGQSIQMPLDALRGAVDRFNRTRAAEYARQEDAADIEQEGEGVQIEQGQTVTYVGADDTQYTATVMTEPDADGYVEIEVQLADGSKFVNRVKADELMQAATSIEGKPTTTAQTSEEEAQLPPPPTNMTVDANGNLVEAQQPTEEQTRAIDRIPSHEANGTKVYDWEKAAPEDTYDALVETFGSMADKGVENSIKDIEKQLKAAEKALQKVEGMTIEQMMANPNAIADAQNLVNALNERKKYWESVKNVPTARAAQAEEERKKKEAENSLPPLPENVTIGEDGSLQAVEDNNEEKEEEPTTEATEEQTENAPIAEEEQTEEAEQPQGEPVISEVEETKEEPTEAAPTAEENTAASEEKAEGDVYEELPIDPSKYYRVTTISELNNITKTGRLSTPEIAMFDNTILNKIHDAIGISFKELEALNSTLEGQEQLRKLWKENKIGPLAPRTKSNHGDIGFQKGSTYYAVDNASEGTVVIVNNNKKAKFLQGHHGSYSGRYNDEIKVGEPVVLREGFEGTNFDYFLKTKDGWRKIDFNTAKAAQQQEQQTANEDEQNANETANEEKADNVQDKTNQNDSEGKQEEKKPQKPTSNRKKRKTKSDLYGQENDGRVQEGNDVLSGEQTDSKENGNRGGSEQRGNAENGSSLSDNIQTNEGTGQSEGVASTPTAEEGKGKKPTAVKGKKIEDVGEKIGGARKDLAKEMSSKINTSAVTFPKMFPKFDLAKMVEKGLDPKMAATTMMLRQEAMKEYKKHKKRRGTEYALGAAKLFAEYAKRALETGNTDVDFTEGYFSFSGYGKAFIQTNIELYGKIYEKMGSDMFGLDLSDYYISPLGKTNGVNRYSYRTNENGEKEQFVPAYEVHTGRGTHYFKEDELDKAHDLVVEKLKENADYEAAHPFKIDTYQQRKDGKTVYYNATRIGGEIKKLGEEYDSLNEAYKFKAEHNAELQAEAARIKEMLQGKEKKAPVAKLEFKPGKEDRFNTIISVKIGDEYVPLSDELKGSSASKFYREHKDELQKKAQQLMDEWFEAKQKAKGWKPQLSLGGVRPRKGEDYRNGKDVSAEQLMNTFGFRGIEFGNYVSQKERQQYMNETYDALMDLAGLLGVDPKALSLGGELGFAVGSRGGTSSNGATAHYEPGKNVINLTKKNGAGALAHEWWHALDYYLNRKGSERKTASTSAAADMSFNAAMRIEMQLAFNELMNKINKSDYRKRSRALDKTLHPGKSTTGYYETPTELGARAFQNYVQGKLTEKGAVNDFLSTFTPDENWNGVPENYPYPRGEESGKIAEAFDNLFGTMLQREDEQTGNIILYHKAEGTAEGVSERDAAMRDAVVDKLREAGIEVVTDTEEAQRILDLANGTDIREHRVYHGTGADFDALDHSHMGEGEGAQAFGWGTYVTEVEGVGRGYAKRIGDMKVSERNFIEGKIEEARKYNIPAQVEYWENELKNLGDAQHYLYEVEIPEDNGRNYIDWKAPLTKENKEDIRAGLLKDNFFRGQEQMTYDDLKSRGIDVPGFEEWLGLRADLLTTSYNGEDFYKGLSQELGGDEIASEFLKDCGFVGIKYPAEALSGGREDGAKNFVIFNEADAKIESKTRFFRTESGEAYGFVKDGKIYLDPRIAGAQTAVHEYTHLWAEALRQSEPEKWKEIADVLQNDKSVAPLMEQVKKNYPELSGDDLIDELLAHYSGKRGAERLNAAADEIEKQNGGVFGKAEAISAIENVKRVLNDFWKKVAELLGFEKKFKNADEVADMVLNDLLSGSAINTAPDNKSGQMRFDFGDNENKRATEEDDFFADDTDVRKKPQIDNTLEKGKDYTIDKLIELFNKYSTDKEQQMLAEKVFKVAKELNFKVQFLADNLGFNIGGRQDYDTLKIARITTLEQNKNRLAQVLLHETIHGVTTYAISAYENKELTNKKLIEAVEELKDTYSSIMNREDVRHEYGLVNEKELIAELANPLFRAKLKEINIWEKIKDAIKKIFFFYEKEDVTANAVLSDALDKFLDNYDVRLWNSYNVSPEVNAEDFNFSIIRTEEDAANTLYSARELVKARQRINSIGNIGKAGTKAFESEDGKRIYNPTAAKNIGEYMVNALQEYKDWLEFYAEDSNATKAYKQRFADHIAEVDKAIEFYNELKDGKITDPNAIYDRDIRYREIGAPLNPRGERMTAQNTSLDEAIAIQGSGIRYSTRVNHNSPFLLKKADGSFVDAETGETLGFDHRFMGTGEGNQAHGWGSYFSVKDIRDYAESEDVSDELEATAEAEEKWKDEEQEAWIDTDIETREEFNIDLPIYLEDSYSIGDADPREVAEIAVEYFGEDRDKVFTDDENEDDNIYEINDRLLSAMDTEYRRKMFDKRSEFIDNYVKEHTQHERHHYDVEIPDNDGTNYIEEGGEVDEKILGKVRAELQSRIDEDGMNADYMLEKMDDVDYMDGRLLYNMLSKYAFDGSDEKASKFLKECGIVGIHYDGRQDGECYVIFDENDAKIVNHERFRDAEETEQNAERDEDAMERDARAFADELGTKVRVVRDVNEIEHPDAATQNRMRESLGWFDPKSGEVVVVIPNNTDAADVRATVLHEIVGHKGLQQVVGKEKFEDFLMKVYRGVDVETRKKINELAARNHWDFYEGIEEYIAQQAERGFEDRENAGLWRKIVQYVRDLLSEAKVRLGMNLGENDVRYMLWKTYQLKKGRRGVFAEAKDVAMQNELGVGNYRYRDNGNNAATHPEGADNELRGVALEYNKRLGKGSYQAIEAIQDSMRSLLEVQRILEERSGKPLEDWENAYMAENAMSSRNNAEYEAWKRDSYKPLTEAVRALMESEGLSREGVEEYLYMKHGIERNREMSVRAAISEKAEREGKKAAHAEIRAQRDAAKQNGTDFKEPTDTERKRLEKQKEAEMQKQLRNDWKQKRDEIRKQYPNDWEKAQRELDKAATQTFGADLDAREYSGLTAIMSTDDVADARTRAYDAVKQLMEDRPQECKALDDAVRNAASITLEKPFRSGLIDRATFDDISDMYEYYIPLRGFSETTAEEVYNYLRGDAGHGYSEPIKRAKGRMSQAESPLTYLVQMAQSALVQGNRNIMKQRFYNMALRRPSDLITVSEAWVVKQLNPQTGAEEWVTAYPQIKPEMSADEVEKAVADFENDMMQREAQGEAFKTGSKKGEGIPYRTLHDQLAEHQVIVKRAGREYVLTVNGNPRLAQAVNGKTNPNSNYEGVGGKVKKGLDDVNRKLSQLYTTANPDFVVSNLMRDTAYTWSMALIKEDAAYAKNFIGHWNKNLPKMWTLYNKLQHNTLNMNDQTEREFKNFVMNGGETGYSTLQELEDIKAELDKDLAKGDVKKYVDRKLEAFDRLNRSVENLARFSAYLASRDAGRTVERSVWDAKEISVNFNKKGAGGMFFGTNGQTKLGNIASSMSAIGRGGYIFWNAGIQGMANISKIAKRNPKKFTAGAAIGFALGWILSAIHGDDDDDELGYGDLPEYVRRSNIVIGAGGHYGTIPLPVEYRVMYGMGELAQRVLSGNEKYTNAELAEKVAATITQALPIDPLEGMSGGGKWYSPLIPSYAKPLAEVAVNSDWTGKPIYYENEWNKRNPEWTKVNEKTTNSILFATSKMLNEWTGGDDFTSGALDINPAIVEHLAQGYLGGLMTFGNRVMKTGETIVGARDFDARNIPVANRIYKQPTEYTKDSRINSEYRKDIEDMRDLKQKERGYRQKAAEGNAEYAEKYRELVRSREYRKMLRFENLYKQVKKLNDDAGGDERAMKQVKRLKKDAVRVMDNEN